MNPSYYLTCSGAQVTRPEREFIRERAAAFSGIHRPTFVNIGVMWGCTVHCLRAGHPTAHIVALDIRYAWKIEFKDELKVKWVTADSRTYAFDATIDLLVIDGDHHYGTITKDITNWTPHIPIGGTVVYHDYAPAKHNLKQFPELADVKRAVNEWRWRETKARRKWRAYEGVDSIVAFRRVK